MKFASPWLWRWKLSHIRIEIKTSIGRFGEKGGYIMKEEMQKKLFHIILIVFVEGIFKVGLIQLLDV